MTLTEFLLKLRETPRTWELDDNAIRLGKKCPAQVVYGGGELEAPNLAYHDLGWLPLCNAADGGHYNPWTLESSRLRQMLLWATGLEQKETANN